MGKLARGILLALLALPAGAQSGPVIRRIEIVGNGRTAGAYIQSALRVSPGDPFDPSSVPELEQRLMNLRLFKSVHIQPFEDEGEGIALRVEVEERWTLIPLPMLAATRGSSGGGLFLLESNLFGRGKQLTAGGLLTTRGTTASIRYRDAAVADTSLVLTGAFSRIDLTREQDAGRTALYQYQDRRYEYELTLGWRLTELLTLGGGYFGILVGATPAGGFAPPPNAPPVRGLSADLEWRDEQYRAGHITGLAARVRYRQGVSWLANARPLRQLSASASWSTAVVRDQTLSLLARFEDSQGDPIIDPIRFGGRPGSRGFIFGGLWAERAAIAAVEYQIPLWRASWGVVAGAGFCDAGLTRWRGKATDYLAPGLGLRVDLSAILLPTIGVDVAQATGVGTPMVSFVAGLRSF